MTKCVLVVDDAPLVRRQMTSILQLASIDTESVPDAPRALERLRTRPYSLVLCDVNMPGMSGLELLEVAQAEGITSRVPFVMVTTEVKASMMRKAKALGARGWVVKPLSTQALEGYLERFVFGAARE